MIEIRDEYENGFVYGMVDNRYHFVLKKSKTKTVFGLNEGKVLVLEIKDNLTNEVKVFFQRKWVVMPKCSQSDEILNQILDYVSYGDRSNSNEIKLS